MYDFVYYCELFDHLSMFVAPTSHHPSPDWIHSPIVVYTGPPCAPFLSEAFSAAGCSPPSCVAPPLYTGHVSLYLKVNIVI